LTYTEVEPRYTQMHISEFSHVRQRSITVGCIRRAGVLFGHLVRVRYHLLYAILWQSWFFELGLSLDEGAYIDTGVILLQDTHRCNICMKYTDISDLISEFCMIY